MRLFGHPVHAIVVALPLALLAMVPVWDFLAWFGVLAEGGVVAYHCVRAGLVGGGLSLLTGVAEWIRVSKSRPEVSKHVLSHAGAALGALSLFVLALVFRTGKSAEPALAVLGLECAGALVLGLTGWLGGQLVFTHGVAVRGVDAASPRRPV